MIKLSFCFLFICSFFGTALAQERGLAAKEFERPVREFSVIVTPEGYYPKHFSVQEGERVKFYVTSTLSKPHCFIVDKHKIFVSASKGSLNEAESVFDNPGRYKFYCPSAKKDFGYITVIQKVRIPSPEVKREISGKYESGPNYWTPKDY